MVLLVHQVFYTINWNYLHKRYVFVFADDSLETQDLIEHIFKVPPTGVNEER